VPAVALSLDRLFARRTGEAVFDSRERLANHFGFQPTIKIVVSGVGYDQHLENYWSRARGAEFPARLAALNPDLVTTPNFSLFSDVPRHDNIYNMKRIAICFNELASLGIPTALHVNARTDHDWSCWTRFVRAHPEVHALAFEFRTGPASPKRGRWYRDRLTEIANRVGRRLGIVVRGGIRWLGDLAGSFDSVTLLSHTPVLKAISRRRHCLSAGAREKNAWTRFPCPNGPELDDLVLHNLSSYGRAVQLIRDQGLKRTLKGA
jgi:hypothetical protein